MSINILPRMYVAGKPVCDTGMPLSQRQHHVTDIGTATADVNHGIHMAPMSAKPADQSPSEAASSSPPPSMSTPMLSVPLYSTPETTLIPAAGQPRNDICRDAATKAPTLSTAAAVTPTARLQFSTPPASSLDDLSVDELIRQLDDELADDPLQSAGTIHTDLPTAEAQRAALPASKPQDTRPDSPDKLVTRPLGDANPLNTELHVLRAFVPPDLQAPAPDRRPDAQMPRYCNGPGTLSGQAGQAGLKKQSKHRVQDKLRAENVQLQNVIAWMAPELERLRACQKSGIWTDLTDQSANRAEISRLHADIHHLRAELDNRRSLPLPDIHQPSVNAPKSSDRPTDKTHKKGGGGFTFTLAGGRRWSARPIE